MKVGFVSLPVTGHLNPMTALARKLQSRGTEVIFIGVPDVGPIVRAANLKFAPFCEKEYPVGSVAKRWGGVAKLHGLDVVEYTSRELIPGLIKAALEHLPEKLRETGVEALAIDTVYRFLELVPMRLGMPYAQFGGCEVLCGEEWITDRLERSRRNRFQTGRDHADTQGV